MHPFGLFFGRGFILAISFALLTSSFSLKGSCSPVDSVKQRGYLEKVLKLLPPDNSRNGRVSFLDATFIDWVRRTGELPPDFDSMPSIPDLPDPLIIDEGGKNIPVKTMDQWKEKRKWMKGQLMRYITGTYPEQPDNLESRIISEKKEGETTLLMVELKFGPQQKAVLDVEIMIPPGKGPFPVFMTQGYHREWAAIAVRRGYIGCVYAAADSHDDTEDYSEIWAGQYDFTRLMRRAYGTFVAVDYLYTLPYVDKAKIALTGHSRNGKLSLMAAAFDERITAVISSSGGSGAEVPWRYNSHKYDVEDIALLACAQPAWLHPRLRFFIGHENKLPVDQNSFMALVAPRALMLSTALSEEASNPWGIEQAWHATKNVYSFLNAEKNLAIRSRYGKHSVSARDLEDYMDFFDYAFGRSKKAPENKLFFPYSFESWKKISNIRIDPTEFPVKNLDDIDKDPKGNTIKTVTDWEAKRKDISKKIDWALGKEPSGVINPGPGEFSGGNGEDNFGTFIPRPVATSTMGCLKISPYYGFGDALFGYLYYPADANGNPVKNNLPVVIYLHEYNYSYGFSGVFYHRIQSYFQTLTSLGYAVFSYDMLGFGNRIEEASRFYERYPEWSKMGKMVADARSAIDALSNIPNIDKNNIYIIGYTLGAKVGLYTAAIDDRIKGVISVSGFTPLRLDTRDKGTEGIRTYSHLHGIIPKLGFFVGNENRIPYDYHEIMALIAPRDLMVIAPVMDRDATVRDVEYAVRQSAKIYSLYGSSGDITLFTPDDYNRFSEEMRDKTYQWLRDRMDEAR